MKNWKALFPITILERGFDYYESGAVTHIITSKNKIHASVEGTKNYDVNIKIENGKILDMQCSCPYAEDGSYCKHMAAVLYEVEQNGNGKFQDEEQTDLVREQELEDIIREIPEEEVRELLLEQVNADERLKKRILVQYAKEIGEKQMICLKKELDRIVYRYADRYGFIDWHNAHSYARAMQEFLGDNVETLIQQGNLMQAFELTNAVFIKVGNQDMDDSDGETELLAEVCCEYWEMILNNCSESEKEQMFSWFEKNHSAGIVIDYMEEYMDSFMMNEFCDGNFLRRKLAMLDEQIEKAENQKGDDNSWSLQNELKNNILKRLEIMEKLHYSKEEIHNYKKKYWNLADVRKLQISEY